VTNSGARSTATVETAAAGGAGDDRGDIVLCRDLGRCRFTEGLVLERRREEGHRVPSSSIRTIRPTCPASYAIGDVIAGPMAPHRREDEGVAAAEIIRATPAT